MLTLCLILSIIAAIALLASFRIFTYEYRRNRTVTISSIVFLTT